MENIYTIGKIAPLEIGQEINLEVSNPTEGITVQILQPGDNFPVLIPEEVFDTNQDIEQYRPYHYYGTVIDRITGAGIPAATIKIYGASALLASIIANANGEFDLSTNEEADSIQITSVGYQGKLMPLNLLHHEFLLDRDVKELDPVTVTATRRNWIFALVVLGIIAHEEKWI